MVCQYKVTQTPLISWHVIIGLHVHDIWPIKIVTFMMDIKGQQNIILYCTIY